MPSKIQAYQPSPRAEEEDLGRSMTSFNMTGSKENFAKSMRGTGMSLDKTATFNKTSGVKGMSTNMPYFQLMGQEDNVGLDVADDFRFNPIKQYCMVHKKNEIEYCSEITGKFYCKQCRKEKYAKHEDDKVLHQICLEVQQKMT